MREDPMEFCLSCSSGTTRIIASIIVLDRPQQLIRTGKLKTGYNFLAR